MPCAHKLSFCLPHVVPVPYSLSDWLALQQDSLLQGDFQAFAFFFANSVPCLHLRQTATGMHAHPRHPECNKTFSSLGSTASRIAARSAAYPYCQDAVYALEVSRVPTIADGTWLRGGSSMAVSKGCWNGQAATDEAA